MKLFVPFSIGLLSFLRLSAGAPIINYPETDEYYFEFKLNIQRHSGWGVYHFHGGENNDSYFQATSRVRLDVSEYKYRNDLSEQDRKDCGLTKQTQRPIMKPSDSHRKGQIYAQIKAGSSAAGVLHLHDFVDGGIFFYGNVKADEHCDNDGSCESKCTVKKLGNDLGNGYNTKIRIVNKSGMPCGMDVRSKKKTKGSDIRSRRSYKKDFFQTSGKVTIIQPKELDSLDKIQLWCLDRDCGNRAKTIIDSDKDEAHELDCSDVPQATCSNNNAASCTVECDGCLDDVTSIVI